MIEDLEFYFFVIRNLNYVSPAKPPSRCSNIQMFNVYAHKNKNLECTHKKSEFTNTWHEHSVWALQFTVYPLFVRLLSLTST